MRYLKQEDTPVIIKGNIYKLIFNLNVIDILQDRCRMALSDLMLSLTIEKTREVAVKCLLKYLILDCIRRKDKENELENENLTLLNEFIDNLNDIEYYSKLLIDTYIRQLKSKKIMGLKEKKQEEIQDRFVDVEYWFYIGKCILGYKEEEVWNSTIGKLRTLANEHAKYNGWIKEEKEVSMLDI